MEGPIVNPWGIRVGFDTIHLVNARKAIDLLKAFVNMEDFLAKDNGQEQLIWKVGIHMVLVLSGVLFALMDRMSGENKHH